MIEALKLIQVVLLGVTTGVFIYGMCRMKRAMRSMDLELNLSSMMIHTSVFSLYLLALLVYLGFEIACYLQENQYLNADGEINFKKWIQDDNRGLEQLIKVKYIAKIVDFTLYSIGSMILAAIIIKIKAPQPPRPPPLQKDITQYSNSKFETNSF